MWCIDDYVSTCCITLLRSLQNESGVLNLIHFRYLLLPEAAFARCYFFLFLVFERNTSCTTTAVCLMPTYDP